MEKMRPLRMAVLSTKGSWQILNNAEFHSFLIFLTEIIQLNNITGDTTAGRPMAWIWRKNMQVRFLQTLTKL